MKFFDLMPIGYTISPVNGGRPGDRDPHQESNALSLGECTYLGRDISKIQRIYHRQCCKYQAIKSTFFRYKTPTGWSVSHNSQTKEHTGKTRGEENQVNSWDCFGSEESEDEWRNQSHTEISGDKFTSLSECFGRIEARDDRIWDCRPHEDTTHQTWGHQRKFRTNCRFHRGVSRSSPYE